MATLEDLEKRVEALERQVGNNPRLGFVPREQDVPVSTLPLPNIAATGMNPVGPQFEFKKVSEVSKGHTHKEPISGYDKMTTAEVIKAFKETVKTAAERDVWLAYERAHLNRKPVIDTYVNWNS